MSPDQYCQEKTAASGSSFYYSFLFLPADRRRAITALYALCREVDDVVDECHDPQIARIKLQWWREEIEKTFAGNAQHPVTKALYPFITAYDLPKQQLLEIVDGMEMDLELVRYQSFDELAVYCYRVAGAVGILSATIFGYRNDSTLDYARDLGTALQLTNILRDLREDAQRGRIYLPLQELQANNIEPEDILNLRNSENLRDLLDFQTQRAHQFYRSAMQHLSEEDRYQQLSGLIMARIYQATLEEIERDHFQVFKQRVSLTPLRKLWLAWRTARTEKSRSRNYLRRNK